MNNDSEIRDLIESQDLDSLILTADDWARSASWTRLASLRDGAIYALEAGHQLWPLAARIDYLFALGGPAKLAGPSVSSSLSRFTPGPLTEVGALAHTWRDLSAEIQEPHCAAIFAQERVLRGEILDDELGGIAHFLDLPAHLLDWEPRYPLADYGIDDYAFPTPAAESVGEPISLQLSPGSTPSHSGSTNESHRHIADALRSLTEVWTSQSNGRCEVFVAQSDIDDALASLGPRQVTLTKITPKHALATMAWAAASGGAYGRRPGAAAGRIGALWVAAQIAELEWPPNFGRLGELALDTDWYLWDTGAPDTGWRLQVAFQNQTSGIAGALEASDAA